MVSEIRNDNRRNAPRVTIATLGCKLNQYESEAILSQFRGVGYIAASESERADVCVVNTCAVTANAERKSRSAIHSLRRKNPEAVLIAAGCMAEQSSESIAAIEGIDVVLGNREKEHLFDFLPERMSPARPLVCVGETGQAEKFTATPALDGLLGRTRAFLKIQDGCSQKCTYCIIPRLRGRGRSMPIQEVKRQIAHLVDRSFVEIVLTGIALGTYGTDLGLDDGLGDLLESVATLKGLQRLRLGSVEPWAISDRLLSIVAGSENICPHLHIPLQSADDSVLKRMNRRYSTADINRIFDKAYALRNDWGFGTDIIVGFPGETSADFNRTRQFLSDSPLSYLHVFPYSSRPETPATKLPDQVPAEEKQERIRMLRDLDSRMRHRFRIRNLNTCHMVLFENRRINGFLAGHSANYLDVYAIAGDELAGEIRHVNLTDLHPLGVKGEIVHGRQN